MKEVEPRAKPVADHEFADLFRILLNFKRAVLAVSGGADSMALLHLVARWHAGQSASARPAVEVATVDHGLRSESAEEARWVADKAGALGFKHTTLFWDGCKPANGLQEAARAARYDLLAGHAAARGLAPAAVVTAHTEEDQAETFLMRLARGSGLDGLAAMPAQRALSADGRVALVRPLLGMSRARLVATLVTDSVEWRDDPSNDNLAFERVRVRAARSALADLGLTNEKIASSARRLLRARTALERAVDEFRASHIDIHEGVYAGFDRETLQNADPEVRIRVLDDLMRAFGGDAKPPRLVQVEALDEASASGRRFAQTLGGCMISAGQRRVRVFREPGVHRLPEIALVPGRQELWDKRFRVSTADADMLRGAGVSLPVSVRCLGIAAYATLRSGIERNQRPPARAAASLPAFWSGDRLVAVPQLTKAFSDAQAAEWSRHGLCTGFKAGLFSATFDSRWVSGHETWQSGPPLLS